MKKFDDKNLNVDNPKIKDVKVIEVCYYCGNEIDESKPRSGKFRIYQKNNR